MKNFLLVDRSTAHQMIQFDYAKRRTSSAKGRDVFTKPETLPTLLICSKKKVKLTKFLDKIKIWSNDVAKCKIKFHWHESNSCKSFGFILGWYKLATICDFARTHLCGKNKQFDGSAVLYFFFCLLTTRGIQHPIIPLLYTWYIHGFTTVIDMWTSLKGLACWFYCSSAQADFGVVIVIVI